LHNYYNIKAEIFYKNNYSLSEDKNEDKNKKVKNSMLSIDNDTENKIIFTKRKKNFIDNDIDPDKYSISLSSDIINKDNRGLISKRSENDSFEKVIQYFINEYQGKDNKENNNLLKNKNNKVINDDNINDNFLKNKLIIKKVKDKINDIKIEKNIINYNNKIKNKNYSIKTDDDKKFCNIIQNINGKNNNVKTSKLSRNSSKLEVFKKYTNNINKKQNYICEILKNQYLSINKNIIHKNRNNDNEIKNINKSINEKDNNVLNDKSDKNIFELNQKLIYDNLLKIESRNNKKKPHKDFISLKSIKKKNNNQINLIKLLKLSNNYILFKKGKMKTVTLNMKSKESKKNDKTNNFKNNNEVKNEQNKFDIIFQSNNKSKSNKKISILNRFSPSKINAHYSTNISINNDNQNLIKYKSEFTSPKNNAFIRNNLGVKAKSITNEKLSPFDSINYEKKSQNKKRLVYNLSYSNNEKGKKNYKINIKLFNIEKNHEKRNFNLISKNFLFKNYTMGKALMGKSFNNKLLINGLNNLKSIINISRNKTKNAINTFHGKSNPHSLSNSKSNNKSNEKKNILTNSSFNTFTIDNKNIFINIKMKNNKNKDEMINSMLKSPKLIDSCPGKSNIKYSKKCKKLLGKKGIFSPINNIKQNFKFNKRLFKIKNNQ